MRARNLKPANFVRVNGSPTDLLGPLSLFSLSISILVFLSSAFEDLHLLIRGGRSISFISLVHATSSQSFHGATARNGELERSFCHCFIFCFVLFYLRSRVSFAFRTVFVFARSSRPSPFPTLGASQLISRPHRDYAQPRVRRPLPSHL